MVTALDREEQSGGRTVAYPLPATRAHPRHGPLSARVPAKVSGAGRWRCSVAGRACLARRDGRPGDRRERERHLVDLELRVSEQTPRVTFRKAAYVDVGRASAPARADRSGDLVARRGLAPLFPVFSGTLSWADDELSLDGYYAPPGGGIGIIADRLLLNVAARGTARLLLEKIAAAMRGEAAELSAQSAPA